MKEIQVAILQKNRKADGLYTYGFNQSLSRTPLKGSRVVVPFGHGDRYLLGIVTHINEGEPSGTYKVKAIADVLPEGYDLTEEQVELALLLKSDCLSSYAEAFQTVSPSGLEIDTKVDYLRTELGRDIDLSGAYFDGLHLMNPSEVDPKALKKALASKQIKKQTRFIPLFKERTEIYVHADYDDLEQALATLSTRAVKQREILFYLDDKSPLLLSQLASAMHTSHGTIEKLKVLELVRYEEVVLNREPVIYRSKRERGVVVLSDAQRRIYEILKSAYENNELSKPYLLQGVTGSGKTEIYIELAKHLVEKQQQVLVLVPEIALTPQLTDKFNRTFEGQVAILHSQIPSKERMEQWHRIKSGELKVIIGARSAIFAPFQNLGLIVMDEEHDDSYKSDTSPRYYTKDIATWLCARHNALLLLASGTPSVESLHGAKEGAYRYLELNERYNDYAMPTVVLVDMKKELMGGHQSFISRTLIDNIAAMKARGEQGILFLNRKGHSTQLICKSCGERVKCPNCDISLTYHKKNNVSLCHYCGYMKKDLGPCQSCQSTHYDYMGVGVEKVEEELLSHLPELRIKRVDSSITSKRGALETIYHAFEAHTLDLLLGTQIISKGIDFNRVSLIGVLGVDAMLSMPDYRANERTFNLLTQLAGRGGRADMVSKVFIQTYAPENPILRSVSEYDHANYMADEMVLRYIFKYPPYVEMAYIVISAEDPRLVEEGAKKFHQKIKKSFEKYDIPVDLSGPNPALYAKIKNRYRMQIIIKFQKVEKDRVKRVLEYYLTDAFERLFDPALRIQLDLKPLSLM